MKEKFVLTPKNGRSVTITVRITNKLNDTLEDLAKKTSRSRNELINMALQYAFENIEFEQSSKGT